MKRVPEQSVRDMHAALTQAGIDWSLSKVRRLANQWWERLPDRERQRLRDHPLLFLPFAHPDPDGERATNRARGGY